MAVATAHQRLIHDGPGPRQPETPLAPIFCFSDAIVSIAAGSARLCPGAFPARSRYGPGSVRRSPARSCLVRLGPSSVPSRSWLSSGSVLAQPDAVLAQVGSTQPNPVRSLLSFGSVLAQSGSVPSESGPVLTLSQPYPVQARLSPVRFRLRSLPSPARSRFGPAQCRPSSGSVQAIPSAEHSALAAAKNLQHTIALSTERPVLIAVVEDVICLWASPTIAALVW